MGFSRKRILWSLVAVVTLSLLGWRIYVSSTFRPAKNFHVVEAGKFYRSAQLTGEEFQEAIDTYGIKTIINLRGAGPGDEYYDETEKVTRARGVKMLSYGFSTKHVPHRKSLLPLLETLRTAERPILVHCRSGADRTSEVSALYAMLYMGRTKEQAMDEQMGWDKLHFELFAPAKKMFINDWKGEDWARDEYDPCIPKYKDYYEQDRYCPSVFPAKSKEEARL